MLTTYFGRSTAGALERCMNLYLHIFFLSFFFFFTHFYSYQALQYEGYLDWGFFGWSWLTQPSTDPLAFYPPTFEFAYSFAKDPLEVYKEVGTTETKSNISMFFCFFFPFFFVNIIPIWILLYFLFLLLITLKTS